MKTEKYNITSVEMARFIDHTNLKPEASPADIIRLCDEAVRFGFASVCINPVFVSLAAAKLRGSEVKVCTVVGFPLGAVTTETKAQEARAAVLAGAREIDMVIPIGLLKSGDFDGVSRDIAEVVRTVRTESGDGIVKVIIETCYLTDPEKVRVCQIAEASGADFVKTSTGFGPAGAVLEDVQLMKNSVGPGVGVKASGGIRTAADAVNFIRAGAARIGTSSGVGMMAELV